MKLRNWIYAIAVLLGLGAVVSQSSGINGRNLINGTVTLDKTGGVATVRIVDRTTAGTGSLEALTPAQAKTLLAVAIADVGGLQAALDAKANSSHTQAWSTITATPTTRAGYGITDAADLTLSNLSNTTTARTNLGLGSLATASSITSTQISDSTAAGRALLTGADATAQRSSLGLENVNNTSDANKPISTAQQTALDGKSNVGHTHTLANITDWGTLPQSTVTSSGTIPATARGTTERCNATSGAVSRALQPSPNVGDWLWTVKSDSSTNACTYTWSGNSQSLLAQHDAVLWSWTGAGWVARNTNIAPQTQVFTSSATWIKPWLVKTVHVFECGGGSGGGAGRVSAPGVQALGGGAGGDGVYMQAMYRANDLPSSLNVTIAAGGNGGAAQSSPSTNGLSGSGGGLTIFGAGSTPSVALIARESNPGQGGQISAGASGGAVLGNWLQMSQPPNPSTTTPALSFGVVSMAGFGGGITAGNTPTNGNLGNSAMGGWADSTAGGLAPGGAGVTPAPHASPLTTNLVLAQTAPSGGAASINSNGGTGGSAANRPCKGGGGGGAARDGFSSGAGGPGGPGLVIAIHSY